MKNNFTAIAILIGFGLVASAIYATGQNGNSAPGVAAKGNQAEIQPDQSPRREGTHSFVYGNPDAEITIVEFSDYECPFCAQLHPTLEQLVDESDGKINWEYRHLPLPSHRNAELAAVVGECVGRNLGNEAFWEYSDRVFGNQRSVNNSFLTSIATELGMSADDVSSCVDDSEVQNQVATDLATARAFGGSGTPFSVIVFPDGTTQPVSGALPYERWAPLLSI